MSAGIEAEGRTAGLATSTSRMRPPSLTNVRPSGIGSFTFCVQAGMVCTSRGSDAAGACADGEAEATRVATSSTGRRSSMPGVYATGRPVLAPRPLVLHLRGDIPMRADHQAAQRVGIDPRQAHQHARIGDVVVFQVIDVRVLGDERV